MNDIHIKYLVVNDLDRRWGTTINTVGTQTINKGDQYPTNKHPVRYLFSYDKGRKLEEYQLVYIVSGEGLYSNKYMKDVHIAPGTMIMLFPNEWHSYSPIKEIGWIEYWVGFEGSNIDHIVNSRFFSKEKPIFTVGIDYNIVDLYRQAILVAREQKYGFQILLAGIVNHLLALTYAYGGLKNITVSDSDVIINKARALIFDNLHKNIKPESIADKLNISYSTFRKFFKEYTGFSPAAYIQEQKINRCKELLTNTKLSSQEIAYEVGFENPDYFCTIFKKKVKMTPFEYRNLTQGRKIISDRKLE